MSDIRKDIEIIRDLVESTPTNYEQDRALQNVISALENTLALDDWARVDPEGRTWTMQPYPAGFVACRMEDGRRGERQEFGNANTRLDPFLVARELAAQRVRK